MDYARDDIARWGAQFASDHSYLDAAGVTPTPEPFGFGDAFPSSPGQMRQTHNRLKKGSYRLLNQDGKLLPCHYPLYAADPSLSQYTVDHILGKKSVGDLLALICGQEQIDASLARVFLPGKEGHLDVLLDAAEPIPVAVESRPIRVQCYLQTAERRQRTAQLGLQVLSTILPVAEESRLTPDQSTLGDYMPSSASDTLRQAPNYKRGFYRLLSREGEILRSRSLSYSDDPGLASFIMDHVPAPRSIGDLLVLICALEGLNRSNARIFSARVEGQLDSLAKTAHPIPATVQHWDGAFLVDVSVKAATEWSKMGHHMSSGLVPGHEETLPATQMSAVGPSNMDYSVHRPPDSNRLRKGYYGLLGRRHRILCSLYPLHPEEPTRGQYAIEYIPVPQSLGGLLSLICAQEEIHLSRARIFLPGKEGRLILCTNLDGPLPLDVGYDEEYPICVEVILKARESRQDAKQPLPAPTRLGNKLLADVSRVRNDISTFMSSLRKDASVDLSDDSNSDVDGVDSEPTEEPYTQGDWVEVVCDYDADDSTELSLRVGQLVLVKEQTWETWWTGELDGRSGLFPVSHVKVL